MASVQPLPRAGHVQVLSNLLDRGLDPQASLDAPRFCIAPSSGDLQDRNPALLAADRGSIVVHFEEGFPRDAVDFVEMAGYRVARNVSGHARKMFGRGQCVVETAAATGVRRATDIVVITVKLFTQA